MLKPVFTTTILLLFLFATGSAWAEWVSLGESDSMTAHIDPDTLRTDGNLRKVWILINFKQRNTDGTMSVRSKQEFDCKNERYRFLAFSNYSEPMTGGKLIFNSENSSSWHEIAPGTPSNSFLKAVCVL